MFPTDVGGFVNNIFYVASQKNHEVKSEDHGISILPYPSFMKDVIEGVARHFAAITFFVE